MANCRFREWAHWAGPGWVSLPGNTRYGPERPTPSPNESRATDRVHVGPYAEQPRALLRRPMDGLWPEYARICSNMTNMTRIWPELTIIALLGSIRRTVKYVKYGQYGRFWPVFPVRAILIPYVRGHITVLPDLTKTSETLFYGVNTLEV